MSKVARGPRTVFDRSEEAKRRRIHGALFTLSASPAKGRAPQVVCIVSKKVASRAVDRNRIKRRCREAARAYVRRLSHSLALVFWARREAARATFADVERDVRTLIGQLPREKVQY